MPNFARISRLLKGCRLLASRMLRTSPTVSSSALAKVDSSGSWSPRSIPGPLSTTAPMIFSDGELQPAEVVDAHVAVGFGAVALTDHDTLAGIDALGGLEGRPLRIVAGVELSIEDQPGRGLIDVHLLGYGFALGDRRLRRRLHEASEAREAQKMETVRRLAAAGFKVDWDNVRTRARGNVGKPHIVAAIEAAQPGVAREELYAVMGPGGAAHVPRAKEMSLDEGVDVIAAAGGVTGLAHPGVYRYGAGHGG